MINVYTVREVTVILILVSLHNKDSASRKEYTPLIFQESEQEFINYIFLGAYTYGRRHAVLSLPELMHD